MSERVLNDGVSLKVEDAKQQRDVGRSIARINSDTMRNLNVTTGDVIQIEGKKVTAAKAWQPTPRIRAST